jgi:hypothetical protein
MVNYNSEFRWRILLSMLCTVRKFSSIYSSLGTAAAQWLRCCATNRNVAGSIPAGVIGIFHSHKILPIALWPWGWFRLWQKWVPGVFPGGKGGRCLRLTTLTPSCAFVMKSGNLNFLEPSGPLQACNGIALSLFFTILSVLALIYKLKFALSSPDDFYLCGSLFWIYNSSSLKTASRKSRYLQREQTFFCASE